MGLRLTLALATAVLTLLLALPLSASASGVAVKNSKGKVVGSWRMDLGADSGAYNTGGTRVGFCAFAGTDPNEVNVHRGNWTPIACARHGRLYNLKGKLIGRAVRQGDRWRIDKRISSKWRKWGTVDTPCKPYYAVGAMRLLNW